MLAAILTAAGITSHAQYVTIPDTAFVSWLPDNGFDTCLSGNQPDTSCPAVQSATFMTCTYVPIKDLTGIQYFTNLNYLVCGVRIVF
jgi:hypothetical protein